MSLRIGEVSKLLDLPVETIRFYEQQDIIKPSRKKDSKYRTYETWDIFYLLDCMKYRNLDFSVKDISRILHTEALDFLVEKIETKEETVRREIQYKILLTEYLENYKRKLETIALNQGNFWFCRQPERKYLFCTKREGETYSDFDYTNPLFAAWMKKSPFVGAAQHISLEDLSSRDTVNRDFWSLIIESHYIPILQLPENKSVKTIPSQLCLSTIINAGDRGELSLKLLGPAISYIHQSGYRICDEITGNLLVRIHQKDKYCRYLEMMIPVKKHTSND